MISEWWHLSSFSHFHGW